MHHRIRSALLAWAIAFAALAGVSGCATSSTTTSGGRRVAYTEQGLASWYGNEIRSGSPTASGEKYRESDYTAAHRTLPMNTRVLVENLRNGKRIIVRINDRGPYTRGRIIDLSGAAARALDMVVAGVVPVRLIVIP